MLQNVLCLTYESHVTSKYADYMVGGRDTWHFLFELIKWLLNSSSVVEQTITLYFEGLNDI